MRSSIPLSLALPLGLLLAGASLALFFYARATRVAAMEASRASVMAREEAAAHAAESASARDAAPLTATREVPPGEPVRSSDERSPAATAEDELITAALRAHARAGFAQGWAELRKDELPVTTHERLLAEFERTVIELPSSMGRNAARQQEEREVRERALDPSDAVAWLASLPQLAPELEDVARDRERFALLFRPRSSGSVVDGPTLGERDPLPDGAVLQFPAGVFALSNLGRGRDPFPKDVTVRGAGMEATLLVAQDLTPHGPLERFTVEDCTVFAERCSLADVRGDPTVLTLRRMRLIGFDCGAGGSYALTLRASAIAASQCRFEGGYGRSPDGLANLMRHSSPLVARFEGCVFERVSLDGAVQPGVVFSGCVMSDLLEEPGVGPLYEGCRITLLSRESLHDESVRRRDLDELFPGWEARLGR